jgi:nucleoside-diphosphate-sugar epimerase
MIEYVWEFNLKAEMRGRFELVFGPGGAWGQCFAGAAGFRGTSMMRDAHEAGRYMLVDVWDSEADHERAVVENAAAYEVLQETLAGLTEARILHGVFHLAQQASVRPTPKGRRG